MNTKPPLFTIEAKAGGYAIEFIRDVPSFEYESDWHPSMEDAEAQCADLLEQYEVKAETDESVPF